MHLVDVGLQNLEHPEYGGWGGRLVQLDSALPFWSDGEHTSEYNPFTKTMDLSYAQTRWIPAIQNDFAARADWCISDYSSANHPPSFKLAKTKIKVKPSEQNQIELKQSLILEKSILARNSFGNPKPYLSQRAARGVSGRA